VPLTLRNIKEDLEDIALMFDGAPELEFRAATKAHWSRGIRPELPARPARLSLSVRPHAQAAGGGVRGRARERADEGRRRDRRIRGMGRGARPARCVARLRGAGPEGLETLVIGAPNLGEAVREDVDGQRDWWS
jgi:hypothetical protein